ncbi:MAG TPA: nucleotidyltransferase family protein [Candidatus Binatia bacterium]|nr:nucleotidyltransferase family protein [Candidatus Binatia bacterium]
MTPTPALARSAPGALRRHLLGSASLRAVLASLAQVGVPALPLKGPVLAEALYDPPEERPFTDLDLLVRRADAPAALGVLAALGYRHLPGGRPLEHEVGHAAGAVFVREDDPVSVPIDLHWELVAPAGVVRRFPVPVEEVWARSVPAPEWGSLTRRLSTEDLLLYLALHLALHHPLGGGRWRQDIIRLLDRFGAVLDWAAVGERAERWGVRAAVAFALAGVGAGPGGEAWPVPPSLRPERLRAALIGRLASRPAGEGRLDHVAALLVAGSLPALAATIVTGVLPPPAWVRARYGTPRAARGYVKHLGRLASSVRRALARCPSDR